MQFSHIKLLLLAGISISIFLFIGWPQNSQFAVNAQENQPLPAVPPPKPQPEVPYVPTPNDVVQAMLDLANVKGDDILYDLGSGDGRIPITAAKKYGTRGVGVEIDANLVKLSQENAQKAGVADKVQFLEQDLFKTDLSQATVVTLYLFPSVNAKLRPKLLRELKPGTRIVSHEFRIGDWKPEKVVEIKHPRRTYTIYYWVVPQKSLEN